MNSLEDPDEIARDLEEVQQVRRGIDIVASRNDVRICASDSFIGIYINYAEEMSQIFKVIVFE